MQVGRSSLATHVAALAMLLLCAAAAACSRDSKRVEAPAEPTPIPLAVEAVGYGQRGTDASGAPLPPGYLFRLSGITADELQAAFDALGTDAVVERPPSRASTAAPDLLVIQPALRVEAGRHTVRLRLPDGRSAAADFEIPAVAYAFPAWLTEPERVQIREGIALAEGFAAREFGIRPGRPITVWAVEGAPGGPFTGQAWRQQIRIWVEHPSWKNLPGLQRRTLVAHEFFHLIQQELTGDRYAPPALAWLIEGSAEVFAARATAPPLLSLYELSVDCWTNLTIAPGTPALEAIDSAPDLAARQFRYTIGGLAAHRLARVAGLRALPAYFEEAGKDGAWQAAFERAFSRDLETFYREFAQYRAELPPAPSLCRP